MLQGPASKASLRNTFDRVLDGILSGALSAAPEGNGLPDNVNQALDAVAATPGDATKELAARTAFAQWLATLGRPERDTKFLQDLFGTN